MASPSRSVQPRSAPWSPPWPWPAAPLSPRTFLSRRYGARNRPERRAKTLQTYVWNLRQALGAESVVTEPMGYRLRVSP